MPGTDGPAGSATVKVLAVDTATEACSVALYIDGEVRERYRIAVREHTRLVLPMAHELLAEAGLVVRELDGLAFGRGPGSFTGVRIAAGVAQGIAFAADLPVMPVSTLAALARGAARELGVRRALVALDARMGEVYWGAYETGDDGFPCLVGSELVCTPGGVPQPPGTGWIGIGTGWAAHGEVLRERLGGIVEDWHGARHPRARDVATLAAKGFVDGGGVTAAEALPVYLREQVARKSPPA